MAGIQSRPPRDGGKGAHWKWVPVEPNSKKIAWLAGPVLWIETHVPKRSVPCRYEMSGGALTCQYDHADWPLVQQGYVPLFTESGLREIITVQQTVRSAVDGIPMWSAVLVRRGRTKLDTVELLPRLGERRWKRDVGDAVGGHDISDTLLTLWRDTVYADWVRGRRTLPQCEQPQQPQQPAPDLSPRDRLDVSVEAIARRIGAAEQPVGDLAAEWMRRNGIPPRSANGKHE